MDKQSQWLFEAVPLLETPHPTYYSLSQEYYSKPDPMDWEAQSVVLQSDRFKGDQRLQDAANNSPPLKSNERSNAVHKLQQALIDLGYPMPITTKHGTQPPDGIYGSETVTTVRHFQSKYGLEVDGIAGRQTLSKLDQLFIQKPPRKPTITIPERWQSAMGSAKVRAGNQVDFLIDGPQTFEAMVKAIKTATGQQHYIYLLGWWLTDNFRLIPTDPNSTIAKLFSTAAGLGVQIRVMLWDQVGSQNSDEVKRINLLPTGGAILDNETLNFGSHHQKVLVVKGNQGLISFCGGVDINPDRITTTSNSSSGSSGGQGTPLHDVHCRVLGPAAHDLLGVFIQRWVAHPGHQKIDKTKGILLGVKEPIPAPIGNNFVRIATTFNQISSPNCQKARSIRTLMIRAIRSARKFIYIEEQYLVSMEAAAELWKALPNIQHLTIVIPHSSISDLPQVWSRRKAFIDLLQSSPHGHKVRVFYLVNPAYPGQFGPFTYVHAKMWIIDDELAIIGSANCNRRGWSHDSEVIAAIYDGNTNASGSLPFAQQLRIKLWSRHLNVAPSLVTDGITSASLWLKPSSGAWIRPYNQNAGKDPAHQKLISWDSIVDPSGDTIPPCSGGVETEVGMPIPVLPEFQPQSWERIPILR
jgi:phosphatidylserine/phosphatidylglycerophosphate/cardiolipin synthase-like enzyme